jgi:hypothetical protein
MAERFLEETTTHAITRLDLARSTNSGLNNKDGRPTLP